MFTWHVLYIPTLATCMTNDRLIEGGVYIYLIDSIPIYVANYYAIARTLWSGLDMEPLV